ncbi:PadR family transcriptional regulator [Paenibacillus phoenicis]|uniref:PadR family transcriptional regulator n=1 Tax=Paenibacillus phoenicis TaxID=554117 RepID=A0ABU5PEX5_9BACL|nr:MULTISPECIES: PadR family transcriptional regulator [Paenibacillus]MCT2193663.1 PadR family transcriptional regulator [Paenibacillus sp. p3-SID1389]MEA3568470.1 PadR family transcriptional regulator [Paenibacillus phoenicis]
MNDSAISRDLIRGHIDTIILRVLLEEGDNYGYEIMKSISSISQGRYELKEPSLYTSLKRLEAQKLIESYWGEDRSLGGRRKYYHVTPAGAEVYKANLAAWKFSREIIDVLIEKQEGSPS